MISRIYPHAKTTRVKNDIGVDCATGMWGCATGTVLLSWHFSGTIAWVKRYDEIREVVGILFPDSG